MFKMHSGLDLLH